MNRIDQYAALAGQLDRIVKDSDDRVAVAVETGEDEAFFVATRDGYARLALALLRASSKVPEDNFELQPGLLVHRSTMTHGTHDPLADIAVSAEFLVDSDEDRAKVVQFFR